MESSFVTNVHELAYAGFFAQECPTAELRIISKFFKASMVVYKAGNVSYNAVMMANTIITDFFVKYHKLFARGISLEFVDLVLTILFCYDGFWDILNRINVHLFYLTYRHQILTILSTRMATMYGAQIFRQIFDRLPLFNLGEDNLGTEERGNFRKAFYPSIAMKLFPLSLNLITFIFLFLQQSCVDVGLTNMPMPLLMTSDLSTQSR
jgi:hypothetical protein